MKYMTAKEIVDQFYERTQHLPYQLSKNICRVKLSPRRWALGIKETTTNIGITEDHLVTVVTDGAGLREVYNAYTDIAPYRRKR